MKNNRRITLSIMLSILLPLLFSCERTDIFKKANSNQVKRPSFSLSSGAYSTTQSVTISSATTGAVILYTTDGTTPTHDGSGSPLATTQVYSTAITVTSSMTIRAIGYYLDLDDSSVATANYTLQVAVPSFSHATGTYNDVQSISISTSTTGASILYTIDDTAPTHDGSGTPTGTTLAYSTAISAASTMTIRAIGYLAGMDDSVEAAITCNFQVASPAFSPSPGTYNTAQTITISSATTGASFLYTTDNTAPTHDGSGTPTGTTLLYSTSINGVSPMTIRAIGYLSGMSDSSETNVVYTIEIPEFYVTNFNDNNVMVIDAATNGVTDTLTLPPGDTGPYTAAANLNTGKIYIGNTGSDTVTVINKHTKYVTTINGNGFGSFTTPRTVFVDEDRNLIYAANYNGGDVTVIDGVTDAVIDSFAVGGWPSGFAIHPTLNKIYVSVAQTNSISIFNTSDYSLRINHIIGVAPRGIEFNPNTDNVFVAVQDADILYEINGTTDGIFNSFNSGVGYHPRRLALDKDNNILYVSNSITNNVSVINGSTGVVIADVPVENDPYELAFDPVNRKVMVANFVSGTVTVIDTTTNTASATITVGSGPRGMCFIK